MKHKFGLIVAGVILAIILLFVGLFAGKWNHIVTLEEQINESKSAITNQYQRRQDLYSTLVQSIKSYNSYEGSTLEAVIAERGGVTGDYTDIQKQVSLVVEKYPELKSIVNYEKFTKEATATENLIMVYRENYNTQVKRYNKYVRQFPNNIVLGIMGYTTIDETYLNYNEAAQTVPTNLFGE